jgi:uncharacterized membrane protein
MSLGLILVIILVIVLLGGLSGRFRGYGYGYGHRGIYIVGIILIVLLVLLLTHRIWLARGLHQKVDGKRTSAETARHIPCAIARPKDAADDIPREWRVKLQGLVASFDGFTVLLVRDGFSQLKHAISTMMPAGDLKLYEGWICTQKRCCAQSRDPLRLTKVEADMALLDHGWTEEQAQGLLDGLKLTGSVPDWKLSIFKDCATGAVIVGRIQTQPRPNLNLSPTIFAAFTAL